MNENIGLDYILNGPRHTISETHVVRVDPQTVRVDRVVVNLGFDFFTIFWEGWWMAFVDLLNSEMSPFTGNLRGSSLLTL